MDMVLSFRARDPVFESRSEHIFSQYFLSTFKADPWAWDDGTPVDYEFWAPNEPNHSEDIRTCARMYTDYFSGGWDDILCEEQGYYVCKAYKSKLIF